MTGGADGAASGEMAGDGDGRGTGGAVRAASWDVEEEIEQSTRALLLQFVHECQRLHHLNARALVGPPLPPDGLRLEHVEYDEPHEADFDATRP